MMQSLQVPITPEGISVDIALLYFGIKSFWRTRETIDVHIVKHKIHSVIEIDCFHPGKNARSSKLYLNSSLIYSKLDTEMIESEAAKSIELLNRKKVDFVHDEVIAEVRDKMSITFILNRLSSPLYDDDNNMIISLIRDEDVILPDDVLLEMNLNSNDIAFIPTASSESMNSLLAKVQADNSDARKSIEEASNHVCSAVDKLMSLIENKKKSEAVEVSKPAASWHKAYKKVSLMNAVDKTNKRLKEVQAIYPKVSESSKARQYVSSANKPMHRKKSLDDMCFSENTGSDKLKPNNSNNRGLPPITHNNFTFALSNVHTENSSNNYKPLLHSVSTSHTNHIHGLKLLRKSPSISDPPRELNPITTNRINKNAGYDVIRKVNTSDSSAPHYAHNTLNVVLSKLAPKSINRTTSNDIHESTKFSRKSSKSVIPVKFKRNKNLFSDI
eukprot:gene6328-8713_t